VYDERVGGGQMRRDASGGASIAANGRSPTMCRHLWPTFLLLLLLLLLLLAVFL
jgi:hypothetical protein